MEFEGLKKKIICLVGKEFRTQSLVSSRQQRTTGFPSPVTDDLSHPFRLTICRTLNRFLLCGKVSPPKAYPLPITLTPSYKIPYAVFLYPFLFLLSSANRPLLIRTKRIQFRWRSLPSFNNFSSAALKPQVLRSLINIREALFPFSFPQLTYFTLFLPPRCRCMGFRLVGVGKTVVLASCHQANSSSPCINKTFVTSILAGGFLRRTDKHSFYNAIGR